MKTTSIASTLITAFVLAACGGGSSDSTPAPAPAPVPSKLAAYVGVWNAPCEGHQLLAITVTETAGVKDSVTAAVTTQHFSSTGCTGTVMAMQTQSTNYTLAYTGTADAAVVFTPGAAGVTSKVDQVTLLHPAYTETFTGSIVTTETLGGKDYWALTFSATDKELWPNQGLVAAEGPVASGLYVNANKLYLLQPNGAAYSVTAAYTKK